MRKKKFKIIDEVLFRALFFLVDIKRDFFVASPIQLGQKIMYYTPKKVLPFGIFYLTRPSKAGKESFLEKFSLSD